MGRIAVKSGLSQSGVTTGQDPQKNSFATSFGNRDYARREQLADVETVSSVRRVPPWKVFSGGLPRKGAYGRGRPTPCRTGAFARALTAGDGRLHAEPEPSQGRLRPGTADFKLKTC
jgi:hypothetical protein